ncbi:MAG: glucose-6-phosphate dehydrogenase [Chlamydiae bacterium]|nr:glucose-6-phosphate dehydrogenase [Chlamydiota bacterium]
MNPKHKEFEVCLRENISYKSGPFIMVIFGGAGDLAQKKLLPTLYQLFKKKLIENFSIVACGSSSILVEEYRKNSKKWLEKIEGFEESVFNEFEKKLIYHQIDLTKEENFDTLCLTLSELGKQDKTANFIYYLAIPPAILPTVVSNLSLKHLCREKKEAKIVVEKPFGFDKKSAHELNKLLLHHFDENQIYRIDHYLGKETIQNIFFFRFGNAMFEPLWNRNYIDHVQITVAEDIGIENRAIFYEQAGVVRDIVQNHIMQLIALIAMEPPINFEADSIKAERTKVVKSIQPIDLHNLSKSVVMGQYGEGRVNGKHVVGYTDEKKVPKDSKTPTFFAGKFFINNWRWENVPFYVRAGKRLKKRFTEIAIQFKYPPLKLLGHKCQDIEANALVFSIDPKQKVSLHFNVKYPGMENIPFPVDMVFDYKDVFKVDYPSPYERILIDIMKGDLTLFPGQDGIEAMWKIVDPIINAWEKEKNIYKYEAGSFGPDKANELMTHDHRAWRPF